MRLTLGYKGLSDVDANRIKVEAAAKQAILTATQAKATAGQAETLVKDVNSKFESASQGEKQFQNQVQENKNILSGFQSSLSELQAKDKELKASGVELQNQMRDLSIEVKKAAGSLSSSVSLSTGLGGIVSTTLNVPVVTALSTSTDSKTSISGYGFGSIAGRIFVKLSNGGVLDTMDLAGQLDSLEIPSVSILSWADNTVILPYASIERVVKGKTGSLLIQIVTNSGSKSNVYSVPTQPQAPSGLNATVQ